MEFVRSLASSLWSSVSFWKAVAIGFALFNLKNLPLFWHVRKPKRHSTLKKAKSFGILTYTL